LNVFHLELDKSRHVALQRHPSDPSDFHRFDLDLHLSWAPDIGEIVLSNALLLDGDLELERVE
jgi:hypothetical protein